MKRCAVIGHGSWATALVKVLVENGVSLAWYVSNPEVRQSLLSTGRNCRYLPDVHLNMFHVSLSDDVNQTVLESEIVFLVTPAAYLKKALAGLEVPLDDKLVISAIKGIIPDENQLVTDFLQDRYHLYRNRVAFICGPTHAEEVSHGKLTYLTVACQDQENARIIGGIIRANYIKIQFSTEMRQLEYYCVMKNVYAVMVGIAVGLGYGDNFTAVLVSNCLKEICQLTAFQSVEDLSGLNPSAFLGDFLASCYSTLSRNRQLGVLLGSGKSVQSALEQMTMVAEGYFASKTVAFMPVSLRQKMPIAELTYQVLQEGLPANMAMERLKEVLQ